ncbi:hypothetical protein D9Q98_001914 [Chlorella vulgaris]|uniref:Nucleolar protein 16 n=1 Tax=Chlorella vulgaris TaxID=3077 RepID=A0A9D4Z087_CHLVU|nr:hypothetical protein D9Q98_001914 [Chlorella vulgaris]
MGGSLRRHKRKQPRIIKRHKKKPHVKSDMPQDLIVNAAEFKAKLGVEPQWDNQQHIESNYEAAGLVADVNAAFGRNRRRDILKEKVEAHPELLDAEPEDEMKAACGQKRSTGKAAPKRLTTHQRQIVKQLIERHGDDVAAMQRDRKLNSMQHSQGVLTALLESYNHWGEGAGVDFRVPNKRLW